MDHEKFYTYGYRRIHPINEKPEEWSYSIQLHKNQNGKHWDFRVHRPGEDKAFSWASKKPPFGNIKPILAMRTHDHNLEHMDFEGPMSTAKGYGNVELIDKGKLKVNGIDEKGIQFEMRGKEYRLRPYNGRKYMFEQILY
jgi:hypothetical protein